MKNKKQLIFSWIAIFTFVLFVIGATYAYFKTQGGDPSRIDVSVGTNTVDTLTFEVGDPISLTASQFDFTKNGNDKVGSTFAKAILSANNKTNSATMFYYLYLVIEENDFVYTQGADYPELILTIEKKGGLEVQFIDGLNYYDGINNGALTGFDVTNKKGVYKIAYNYPISTTDTTTDEWDVKLTFVNYDKDQSKNAGHSFSVKLLISSSNLPDSIDDVCNNGDNINDCLVKLNNESSPFLSNLYYHDGSFLDSDGNILDAEDKSYRYFGEDVCMYKDFQVMSIGGVNACKTAYYVTDGTNIMGVYDDTIMTKPTGVKWDSTNNKCVTLSGEDVNSLDGDITEDTCTGTAYYVIFENVYFLGIIKATDVAPYKYSSVNNYICFGSTENNCPEDNLYRIIGSFKNDDNNNYNLKLIKATPATKAMLGDENYSVTYQEFVESKSIENIFYKYGSDLSSISVYKWNNSSDNTWSNSTLNNINLNTNFISYLDSLNTGNIIWKNQIIIRPFYANGFASEDLTVSTSYKKVFQSEINDDRILNSSNKIGLLYISDFLYSSINNLLYSPINEMYTQWMFIGLNEWSITSSYARSQYSPVYYIGSNYNIFWAQTNNWEGATVRPVFYLQSGVNYVSGRGTSDDPIRVSFD